jgi:hypothetical protein
MTQRAPRFSPSPSPKAATSPRQSRPRGSVVTDARAAAQRAKIEAEREAGFADLAQPVSVSPKKTARPAPERSRQGMSLAGAIDAFIQDHIGGNHSPKTLEWHQTSLGLFASFLQQEGPLRSVRDIEPTHITGWLALFGMR